jgi:hypothetical protein
MSSLFDWLGLLAYASSHSEATSTRRRCHRSLCWWDAQRSLREVEGGGRAAPEHAGYIKEMCEEHAQELERKGLLPKET